MIELTQQHRELKGIIDYADRSLDRSRGISGSQRLLLYSGSHQQSRNSGRTRRSRLEAHELRTCGRKTRRNQVLAPQSKAKKLELKEP